MTTLQSAILLFAAWFNALVALFAGVFALAYFKFPELRKHVLESIQDGDNITHQQDGKFVVALILGLFSALFTANVTLCLIAFTTLEWQHIAVISGFAGITFTLLGVSWKGFSTKGI